MKTATWFEQVGIKSIEVFMSPSELKVKHSNIFTLVEQFVNYDKTTVRIYSEFEFMENVYKLCDNVNVRCQRYVI
jgi:hypothetical protein